MKVSELMIHDLVYDGRDKVIKVSMNYGPSIKYHEEDTRYNPSKTVWREAYSRSLSPIPITEEILKENGFTRSGIFMSKWWNEQGIIYADGSFDNHIDISICGNDYHSEYLIIRLPHIGIGMPLYYVHELQHALRLCGLNELADNFIVQ